MGDWEESLYCAQCDRERPHWCADSTAECARCGAVHDLDDGAAPSPVIEDGEFSLYEVDPWTGEL